MFKKVFRVFGVNFVEVEKVPAEKREKKLPVIRVVLCGECTAGKSVLWGGLAADDTHVDPSLRGVSLVRSALQRDEKCELSLEYLNVRDALMTLEVEAKLKGADCFLVCFDWCSSDSIAATDLWLELAKRLSPDPMVFLVGLNLAELSPASLPAKREQLEKIKATHFCFKAFEIKPQFHQTISRECSILKRMIAGDCLARCETIRKRTFFRPLDEEPDWEFKLVG